MTFAAKPEWMESILDHPIKFANKRVIAVRAHAVRSACVLARKHLGLKLSESREVLRSGGEDGLYRVHLADGTIVECTIQQRAKAEILAVDPA
jgi:hypothetical protein